MDHIVSSSDMEWKLLGSITGSSNITISTTIKIHELCAEISGSYGIYSVIIPYSFLTDSAKTFGTTSRIYTNYGNDFGALIVASKTAIGISNYVENRTFNIPSGANNAILTVYYR